MPKRTPRTVETFLQELESRNQTLASWAREKGLAISDCYAITRGLSHGRRGKAREVLLAMGVPPPPSFVKRAGKAR